jgi:hypothetical protein
LLDKCWWVVLLRRISGFDAVSRSVVVIVVGLIIAWRLINSTIAVIVLVTLMTGYPVARSILVSGCLSTRVNIRLFLLLMAMLKLFEMLTQTFPILFLSGPISKFCLDMLAKNLKRRVEIQLAGVVPDNLGVHQIVGHKGHDIV